MSTVKRILEMARADCELNWWHSDGTNLMPPKGKVCAGTALQIAGGVLNVSEEIIQNAYDSFRRQLPQAGLDVDITPMVIIPVANYV